MLVTTYHVAGGVVVDADLDEPRQAREGSQRKATETFRFVPGIRAAQRLPAPIMGERERPKGTNSLSNVSFALLLVTVSDAPS